MATCITPYMLKDPEIAVPCGKCPPCRSRRSTGWAFRMIQQQKVSNTSFMVTLTYNSDFIPITQNGYRTIDKTHLQDYFKRLRKHSSIKNYGYGKISYYACGEYGTNTKRPHYHVLLYNAHPDNIAAAWKLGGKEIGSIHIAPLNMATIQYAFKYLQKAPTVGKSKQDDRNREFQLFSKGLGSSYLTPAMVAWHKADLKGRFYCPDLEGKKVAMPRYYKEKLLLHAVEGDLEELELLKYQLSEHFKEKSAEEYQKLVDEYGESLPKVLHERRINSFIQMHKKERQNQKL